MAMHSAVRISRKLVALNSLSALCARMLNVVIILWLYEVLLRSIPAEEFAIFSVLSALMVFAPLFTSVLTGGVSRYAVEAYAKGDRERVTTIVSSVTPFLIFWLLILLLGGLLAASNIHYIVAIPETYIPQARAMMSILVVAFVFQVSVVPLTVGFHIRQKFVLLDALGVSRELVRLALLVVFLYGIRVSVFWVVVANSVPLMAYSVATALISTRLVPEIRVRLSRFSLPIATTMLSFGIWTTLGQLSNMLRLAAGTIILNRWSSPVDVTNYHLASTFDRQLQSTTAVVSAPVQPALTAMHSVDDRVRLGNAFLRGGRYILWATMAIACPLIVFGENLVTLYVGNKYAGASVVLALLLACYPFNNANAMLPKIATATARIRTFVIGTIITHLAGVLVMIIFVAALGLGAVGVAIASLIVSAVAQVSYFWWLALRLSGTSPRGFWDETLRPGLLPSFVCLPSAYVVSIVLPPESVLSLAMAVAFTILVYGLTVVVFGFGAYEKKLIRRGGSWVFR